MIDICIIENDVIIDIIQVKDRKEIATKVDLKKYNVCDKEEYHKIGLNVREFVYTFEPSNEEGILGYHNGVAFNLPIIVKRDEEGITWLKDIKDFKQKDFDNEELGEEVFNYCERQLLKKQNERDTLLDEMIKSYFLSKVKAKDNDLDQNKINEYFRLNNELKEDLDHIKKHIKKTKDNNKLFTMFDENNIHYDI